MKKIALVHDFIYTYGGAERVLSELHQLFPDAPIYTAFVKPEVVERHFPKADIRTTSLQHSPLRRSSALLLTLMPRAVEEHDLQEYDVVISSSGAFSHGIITGPQTLHVSYCHSPMRYAWDWHAEALSERGIGRGIMKLLAANVLHDLRLWDAVSAKRVDRWLANSSVVKKRIETFYRAEATVVYPPIDTEYFDPAAMKRDDSLPERYLFAASRLTASKHVDWMIEAAADLRLPLLIAGEGAERESLQALADRLKADVRFLGFVSEDRKRTLLSQATAFLFPVEDDFGMAPVEALSMGTPVVAYGRGGATETVQDGKNGIQFHEPNASSLTEAARTLLEKGVSMSSKEIRESAQKFGRKAFQDGIKKAIA